MSCRAGTIWNGSGMCQHLKITTRLPDRVDVWNKKRNFVFWESCGEDWGFTFPGTTLAANSNFDAVNSQRVFPYGLKKHHLLGPTPKVWKSGSSVHVLRMNISKNEPTSATRMWSSQGPLGADTGKGIIFMPINTLLSTPSYLADRVMPCGCGNPIMISNGCPTKAVGNRWSILYITCPVSTIDLFSLILACCSTKNGGLGGLLTFTTMHIQGWKLTSIPKERI